jgi:hypothetical protein
MQANGQDDRAHASGRDDTFGVIAEQLSAIAQRLEQLEASRRTLRKAKAGHRDIEPSVEAMIGEVGSVTIRDVTDRLSVTHKTAYLAMRAVAFHGAGRLELEPHGKSLRLRLYALNQPSASRPNARH